MMMMCARAINVRLSGLMRYVRNLEGALRRTADVSVSRFYLSHVATGGAVVRDGDWQSQV